MKLIVITILVFFFTSNPKAQGQKIQKLKILDTITKSWLNSKKQHPILCEEISGFSVSEKAYYIIDSLKQKGVDTILYYEHSTITHNEYGKIIWQNDGNLMEVEIDCINSNNLLGIISVEYRSLEKNIFDSISLTQIDTAFKKLKISYWEISHDSRHSLLFKIGAINTCFSFSNLTYQKNQENPLSQIVNIVSIDWHKFTEKLEILAKKYS